MNEETEKLRLKTTQAGGEPLTCPGCGRPFPYAAVICIHCGYDIRTGRRLSSADSRRFTPVARTLILLILLGVAGTVFLLVRRPEIVSSALMTGNEEFPQVTSQGADQQAGPGGGEHTPSVRSEAARREASGTEAGEDVFDPQTGATAERPLSETDAQLQKDLYLRAWTELNRRLPLHRVGDPVDLRQQNGLMRRGIFRGLVGGQVLLEGEGSTTTSVAVIMLDRPSRLSVDPQFRQQFVDAAVRQRMAAIQNRSAGEKP